MGRIIPLETMQNLRDIGGEKGYSGKTVRTSKIFRSGRPSDGTEADLVTLEDLGTNLVIDLRSADESASAPDPPIGKASVLLIPVSADPVTGRAVHDVSELSVRERMKAMYREIILGKDSSKALGDVFSALLDNSGGVSLLHCTAGKDRTGIVTALIYELLGVGRERIILDYMLTNECLTAFADRLFLRISSRMDDEKRTPEFRQSFYDSMFVREEYILSMYDAIAQSCGTPEEYLREVLGLGESFIRDFRRAFLEG